MLKSWRNVNLANNRRAQCRAPLIVSGASRMESERVFRARSLDAMISRYVLVHQSDPARFCVARRATSVLAA